MKRQAFVGASQVTLACLAIILITPLSGCQSVQAQALTPQEQCATGRNLYNIGQHEQALPHLQAALSPENRALLKWDETANCGFALAYIQQKRGEAAAALEAFTFTLKAVEQSENPANQIGAYVGIGQTQHALRNLPESVAAFNSALQLASQIEAEAERRQWELIALQGLDSTYGSQGQYEERLNAVNRLISLIEQSGEPDQATQRGYLLPGLISLNQTFDALGRFTEGREAGERALALSRRLGNRDSEATILMSLAGQASSLGRSAEALDLLDQAHRLYKGISGAPGRVGEVQVMNLIALELNAQGRYGDALATAGQALQLLETITLEPAFVMFSKTSRMQMLNTLSLISRSQGDLAAAREYNAQALAIARELKSEDFLPTLLNNRGTLLQQAAATSLTQADEQALLREALADYREALSLASTTAQELTALTNVGAILNDQGQPEEAGASLQEALQSSRSLRVPSKEAYSLLNLGLVSFGATRYAEALEHCRQAQQIAENIGASDIEAEAWNCVARSLDEHGQNQAAIESYERAMAVIGQVRATAGDDQARAGFVARYASVYGNAAFLYARQGDTAAAFQTIERGRARSFFDSLATGDVAFADAALKADAERLREADASLEAARRELAVVRQTTPTSPTLVARLEARVDEAEQEYRAAYDVVTQRDDQGQALAPDGFVRSLAEIQTLLPTDTSLLSFYVGSDATLAFVITRSTMQVEELAVGREQLVPLVRTVVAFDGDGSASTRAASELYTTLVAPVRDHIQTPRLLIVPHGVLHYLPFAALPSGAQRFLGDDYTLALLPAASLLPFLQRISQTDSEPGTILVMANPDARIPDVLAAAESIGTLLGQPPRLREQATKEALRDQGSAARIIHLGAHGTFTVTSPLQSSLQLYDGEAGRLTVGEIYGLDLQQADLVTLSACETQVNQIADPSTPLAVTAGDELVGFQRAFFFAGAQNVVTTLWQVPDQPSRLLMERFYSHIRDDLAPANALQRAQQEVRAQYPSPRDWAGFVLSGVGATPIVLPPTPWWQQVPWWGWALGASTMTALLGGAVFRAQRRKQTLATNEQH